MTQTDFDDNVMIDGSRDITQLRVQGYSAQTDALQTWEDSIDTVLAQISDDGRLHVGDDLGFGFDSALVEIARDDASVSKPARGLNAVGQLSGAVSSALEWIFGSLELLGSGGVSTLVSSLRARLTHSNSGDSSNAVLRAGDFEVVNETGSSGTRVGQAVGVRAAVSNESAGYLEDVIGVQAVINNENVETSPITNAYGLKVEDVEDADNNFAVHTGKGLVHLGDAVELETPGSVPGTPGAGVIRVYPKSDKRLYAKNEDGDELLVARQVIEDSFANRPTSDVVAGDLFVPSDGFSIDLYDGSAWQSYGPLYKLTPPDLSEFTWVNQESAVAVQEGGSIYLETGLQSSDDFRILKKSAPSTPYTVTALINPLTWHLSNNSFGLIWRESSSGKFLIFGHMSSATFAATHRNYLTALLRFNSPTSWNGETWEQNAPVAASWLRLEDDGTNRKIHVSVDGQHWIQLYSQSRTTFITADEVGFAINAQDSGSAGNGKAAIHLLSWQEA